jgi:hypothetical protein
MIDSEHLRQKARITAMPAMLLPEALILEATRSTLSAPIQPGIDDGHVFYESAVVLVHQEAAVRRK